jgi:hypothetical protein
MKTYRATQASYHDGRYYEKGQVAEFADDEEVPANQFAPFDEAKGSALPKNHPLLSNGEALEIEASPTPRAKMGDLGVERADKLDALDREAGVKPPLPVAPAPDPGPKQAPKK